MHSPDKYLGGACGRTVLTRGDVNVLLAAMLLRVFHTTRVLAVLTD